MYTLKIDDFNYKIDNENLIFLSLKNNTKNIFKILDKYNINGKNYILSEISFK